MADEDPSETSRLPEAEVLSAPAASEAQLSPTEAQPSPAGEEVPSVGGEALPSDAAKPSASGETLAPATGEPAANSKTLAADCEVMAGEDAAKTQLAAIEMRIERVLKENIKYCSELSKVGAELEKARLTEEELQVTWRGASNVFSRQKIVAENLQKSAQQQSRVELQRLAESANQQSELRSVHSQLGSVNRQLEFAVNLQAAALAQCENKITARTRRIRKIEMAIYRLVAQAQCHASMERSVANLVSKCGPLVHNVLSREAQRQALELAEREEAAHEGREASAAA